MGNTLTQAETRIKEIQGQARTRIVTTRDLYQVLAEAQIEGWGYTSGGTVANAYRYPAHQMRLAAVRRTDGQYAIWCDWGSASKGASPLPGALPRQYRADNIVFRETLRQFADSPDCIPLLLLSRTEVNAKLRVIRAERRVDVITAFRWSSEWDGPVTVQDSVEAGNCATQTAKIAAQLRHTRRISARLLRQWIIRHQPQLAHYADKAIEHARQVAVTC